MESLAGVLARLTRIETDIETNNRYRHEMRGDLTNQRTDVAVIRSQQTELKEDMAELKESMKWVLRSLIAAIITSTGLIVTILVAVFTHG